MPPSGAAAASPWAVLGLRAALGRAHDFPAAVDEVSALMAERTRWSNALPGPACKAFDKELIELVELACETLPAVPTSRAATAVEGLARSLTPAAIPSSRRRHALAVAARRAAQRHAGEARKHHHFGGDACLDPPLVQASGEDDDGGGIVGPEHLPSDVLRSIFSLLDARSLAASAATCRTLRAAAADEVLFRTLAERAFGPLAPRGGAAGSTAAAGSAATVPCVPASRTFASLAALWPKLLAAHTHGRMLCRACSRPLWLSELQRDGLRRAAPRCPASRRGIGAHRLTPATAVDSVRTALPRSGRAESDSSSSEGSELSSPSDSDSESAGGDPEGKGGRGAGCEKGALRAEGGGELPLRKSTARVCRQMRLWAIRPVHVRAHAPKGTDAHEG